MLWCAASVPVPLLQSQGNCPPCPATFVLHPSLPSLPPSPWSQCRETVNSMTCFICLKPYSSYVNKLLVWSEYIGKTNWQIWNKFRRLSLFPYSWFEGIKMSTQATPPPELLGVNSNSPPSLPLWLILLHLLHQISVKIWIFGSDLSHGTEIWDFFRKFLPRFATVDDLGDNQLCG